MIALWTDIQNYLVAKPWVIIGFAGQFLFMMRFVVQWVHSERLKKSVVPVAFWFFSMGGGLVLLVYAIKQQDPVFIMGQGLGLVIYLRNLWLIFGHPQKQTNSSEEEKLALSVVLDELEKRLRTERQSLLQGTGRAEQIKKLMEH
jgi:lipid-A-disaccharide synthase-like uncharacterized protein